MRGSEIGLVTSEPILNQLAAVFLPFNNFELIFLSDLLEQELGTLPHM